MNKVLLVDDDVEFCALLSEYLAGQGFDVRSVNSGEDGLEAAGSGDFDIMILDVMLPGRDGIAVLRELRGRSSLPVLMLTARGDDVDRIVGLELGADDYLPKPCNPREVSARLRAILRRSEADGRAASRQVADLVVDSAERSVRVGDRTIDLTSTEFAILSVLADAAGRVVPKASLSEKALGRELGRYDRAVDMHVSNLRRKLGPLSDGRERIETVRGIGYQLIDPGSPP